jgi:ABC-2 type transport system permease protein
MFLRRMRSGLVAGIVFFPLCVPLRIMNGMLVLLRKEVGAFFNSLMGYMVLVVFLVASGLFFWVFPDNLLETGAANLDSLFSIAPFLLLFLVPAITMRAFSEEFKTGTIEYLATKPLRDMQIILGKYLAAVVLVVLSLLPTLVYYASVYYLAEPVGNLDKGTTWGAYLGLLGVGAVFAAIGIWCSTLSDNQIVAFVVAVFFCFFFYTGFDLIADLQLFGALNVFVLQLGVLAHYQSISRGVLDVRDVLYFASVILLFVLLSRAQLAARKR